MAVGLELVLRSLSRAAGRRPKLERIVLPVPGHDPAHDGPRLVQLSDLHAGHRTSDELIHAAVEEANALSPDAVMLTGTACATTGARSGWGASSGAGCGRRPSPSRET